MLFQDLAALASHKALRPLPSVASVWRASRAIGCQKVAHPCKQACGRATSPKALRPLPPVASVWRASRAIGFRQPPRVPKQAWARGACLSQSPTSAPSGRVRMARIARHWMSKTCPPLQASLRQGNFFPSGFALATVCVHAVFRGILHAQMHRRGLECQRQRQNIRFISDKLLLRVLQRLLEGRSRL